MEFLKTIKRRSFISEVVYVGLNICLAFVFLLIIRLTGSLWLAFALILISKWRVFAVRPRYWFANIQADLVSLIVSIGFVVFLYMTNFSSIGDTRIFIIQIFWTLLYIGWLLFLKPQSKRKYIAAQAGVALFVGITSVFAMSYDWIASPVIILIWLIGYAVTRHVLNSYDEETHIMLLSSANGLVFAEIGWCAYHWTKAYQLPIPTGILLPQIAIILLSFSFVTYKAYNSYYHHQKVRINDIILPLIFSICLAAVLILFFNGVTTSLV